MVDFGFAQNCGWFPIWIFSWWFLWRKRSKFKIAWLFRFSSFLLMISINTICDDFIFHILSTPRCLKLPLQDFLCWCSLPDNRWSVWFHAVFFSFDIPLSKLMRYATLVTRINIRDWHRWRMVKWIDVMCYLFWVKWKFIIQLHTLLKSLF